MFTYTANNIRVIDGDTIECDIDLGFNITITKQKCRLAGINAPEMSTPEGPIATAALQHICDTQHITIVTTQTKNGSTKREKYGRWLATLYGTEPGPNINQQLVDTGHATPLTAAQ